MVKLQHPAFADVTREVEDSDEQEWLDAGWILAPAEVTAPAEPAVAAPDTEPAVTFGAPAPDTMETSGDEHN